MSRLEQMRVLPHEWVFGLLWAMTLGGLAWRNGLIARDALVFLALLASGSGLVWWSRRGTGEWPWRLRLWFYPLAMNATYFALRTAAPAVTPVRKDAVLQQLDAALVGGNLSLRLEPLAQPWLTDAMSIAYAVFFPVLLGSWVHYHRAGLPLMKRFFTGFFTVYGVGFLGYLFMPAQGPVFDPALAAQFARPLPGGWLSALNARIVTEGCNRVDCFPSLHCAISCFVLGFDWRHSRRRFWVYLGPCLALWVATIYLRYHYFVDVLAGLVLAAFTLWGLSWLTEANHEPPPV